ncbi:MAG: hypothetical protein MOGMAGMI_01170 [Candidatus Omnitrophica bacterium]|nr:hypothetical protein [Candidatus Omnitrophota bacterium]
MRAARSWVGLFLVCALAGPGWSDAAGAATNFASKRSAEPPIEAPRAELAPGEYLVYEVYWMGFHVGRGTLEVSGPHESGGQRVYRISAHALTNDFLSKLYPVHDEIHAVVESGTLHTLEFSKVLREGRYRADERIVYDYAAMKGRYESRHNGSTKDFELPGRVRDLLATFYWFRTQAASPGQSLNTTINTEEKNWDAELKILRRERKEWKGAGRAWDTLVVEPVTHLKGILYDRGRAWVWFSADASRTPVWIQLKTPYGPVNGVLNLQESRLPGLTAGRD